ncbi:MAG: hypothetical protein KAJ19_27375 [Gammaproteobacteria bacterium]|nr:hypothetical protein [Gammaproteobacteria bacterium]
MKLPDLARLTFRGKYSLARTYPEIGHEDQLGNLFDVFVRENMVAAITSGDTGAGEAYRSYGFTGFEVIDAFGDGRLVTVTEKRGWPVTAWRFQRLTGPEDVESWDRSHDEYDDSEDEAKAWSEEMFKDPAIRADEPTGLKRFKYVLWRVLVLGRGWLPAGVVFVKPDRTRLVIGNFAGFEDDALFWEGRYEFVPDNFLSDVNSQSGRDEMFSDVHNVMASSFDDALERSKYAVAKEHYEQTGRSLY